MAALLVSDARVLVDERGRPRQVLVFMNAHRVRWRGEGRILEIAFAGSVSGFGIIRRDHLDSYITAWIDV